MKLIAFILSAMVILLTIMPCMDDVKQREHVPHSLVQNSHQQEHPDDDDQCSPFCTCNCCATPIVTTSYINELNIDLTFNEFSTIYKKQTYHSPQFSIWQPPKIC